LFQTVYNGVQRPRSPDFTKGFNRLPHCHQYFYGSVGWCLDCFYVDIQIRNVHIRLKYE
jgi:hypothetical protein